MKLIEHERRSIYYLYKVLQKKILLRNDLLNLHYFRRIGIYINYRVTQ